MLLVTDPPSGDFAPLYITITIDTLRCCKSNSMVCPSVQNVFYLLLLKLLTGYSCRTYVCIIGILDRLHLC